jgi:hypothetical protein
MSQPEYADSVYTLMDHSLNFVIFIDEKPLDCDVVAQ